MDDDAREELRVLRARAYGPSADIARDPLAVRRLDELEALSRPMLPEAAPSRPEDVPAEPAEALPAEPADAVPAVEEVPGPKMDAAAPAKRLSRRMRAAWIASLVAAVAVSTVVTLGVTLPLTPIAPIAPDRQVRSVATLGIDPGFVTPQFFGSSSEEVHGFQEFYGLTLVFTETSWMGYPADGCIVLYQASNMQMDSDSFSGMMYTGCGVGAFPATIQLRVGAEMPAALRERFPDGTGLQFVQDGSRVGVFSDAE